MPPPQPLKAPKQLLVEGRTSAVFCEALIRELALSDFQLQNYGGITELRLFLQGLRRKRGFTRQVTSLAIIRDAEASVADAFRSVGDSLTAARLPVPTQLGVLVPGRPAVAVFLFPDCANNGMLEDLCWQAVDSDPAVVCVQEYFACLARQKMPAPTTPAKAWVQAFLASRPRAGLLVGQAAQANYFPWSSPAFDKVKRFLQDL